MKLELAEAFKRILASLLSMPALNKPSEIFVWLPAYELCQKEAI